MVASKGFTDKLYWRVQPGGIFHCYAEQRGGGLYRYRSLCGTKEMMRSGGQAITRPEPIFRCGLCDGREAERRGWDGSGPATISVLGGGNAKSR